MENIRWNRLRVRKFLSHSLPETSLSATGWFYRYNMFIVVFRFVVVLICFEGCLGIPEALKYPTDSYQPMLVSSEFAKL